MGVVETMSREFGSASLRQPITKGEAYGLFDCLAEAMKDTLPALRSRVDALDGGAPAKAGKPRVRVGAKSYVTHNWGGTYETTDGITYRLVQRPGQ